VAANNENNRTTVARKSDTEILVTRSFDAPARIVFEAWTKADLFQRWWVPKSLGMALSSCEMDVRTGGGYRIVFANSMAFFGRYLEVVPNARLVWTNEESPDGAVTTVTFEEKAGKTLLTLSERYPTKESHEANAGSADGLPETFAQLDAFLAAR
jgi:uncharacterized protein YndB with AHSA1/START domain